MPGAPILIAIALAAAPPPDPADRPAASVTVERVVWPVICQPARRHATSDPCEDIRTEDVMIEEGGARARVTAVERTALAELHVLLVDASASMRHESRLRTAKQAAADYVSRLPPRARVMVASFDDSVVLHSGPTGDRAETLAAVDAIELGNTTALWDALRDVSLYAASLPGRKFVVLLSDGEDFSSLSRDRAEELVRELSFRPDLSIFPIGISLEHHPSLGRMQVLSILRQLAEGTGGRFFLADGREDQLPKIFREITDHAASLRYVVYEPPHTARRDDGIPRVEVRSANRARIRLASAGPGYRADVKATGALRMETAGDGPAVSIGRPLELLVRGGYVDEGAALRGAWQSRPAGAFRDRAGPAWAILPEPGDWLTGIVPDVMADRGVLYDSRRYERDGRLRSTLDRDPQVTERVISLPVPREPAHLPRSPVDVLLALLVERSGGGKRPAAKGRSARLIHGTTFLELRPLLGLALMDSGERLEEFVEERIAGELRPEVERLVTKLEQEGRIDAASSEALFASVPARARAQAAGAAPRFLADWLGDVPVRAVALELEKRLADALRQSSAGSDPTLAAVARRAALEGWPTLARMFPQAADIRVLVPLVPAYSPERDRIGFYRFLLACPRLYGPPRPGMPERPTGLIALADAIENSSCAARAIADLRVTSVEHRSLDRGELRDAGRMIERAGFPPIASKDARGELVEISFAAREAGQGPLALRALYAGETKRPVGVALCPAPSAETEPPCGGPEAGWPYWPGLCAL
jgi:Mg-chelatase subunit ChlD